MSSYIPAAQALPFSVFATAALCYLLAIVANDLSIDYFLQAWLLALF
jgi:hypothetical protein